MRSFLVAAALAAAAPLAIAQGSIKIAILGPMTFVQGADQWAGAEMARDEINKAGGIAVGGRSMQIELVRVDTNEILSVTDSAHAMERAITRDKADFLIGGFRSEAVLAMQEIAMDNRKIFLGAGAGDARLGENVEKNYIRYKYWFRVAPIKSPDLFRSLMAVLASIGDQVRQSLKKEQPKVAILAEKAVWTEPVTKGVQASLPKMNMEVVGIWQPSPLATDVTAELSAIERAGADIVFTLLAGPVGIALGRQMGERGAKAVAFGVNVEAQKDEYWRAAAGRAQFVSTLHDYSEVEITPKTIPFVRAFYDRYRRLPSFTAATYDAISILKLAIEQAGTTDADKLVPLLEKMEHVGTVSTANWDKRHDLVWAIGKTAGIAVQWQDGKRVPFWPPQVKGMQPFKMPVR